MRKRKTALVIAMAAALAVPSTSALACTGLYVGKEASENGATVIARTVDLHPLAATFLEVVVDRVENEPGRTYDGVAGFSWELPDTTYKYTSTPMATGMGFGRYGSACANECGVAITGTVTAYIRSEIRAMDPPVKGGLCEEVVTELVAATCKTAREGVELIGQIMEELGSSEQNILMIADQTEAWYVETYTGHQWAAVKMPEDAVSVYGNEFMIQYLDPEDENVMCSPELFSMPEEAGLAVKDEESGQMDIFATYSGRLENYANRRTWVGHTLLAPSTAGDYATNTKYDLFYKPDEKVSVEDVLEVFRNRFEGTEFSPDETGRIDQRVIGTESQGTAHVIEVYDNLPAEMACVTWACLANSEHSVYLPVSNLVTDTAEAFKADTEKDSGLTYDDSMASIIFKRLCALSEQDRKYYGAGVRDYWHSVELGLLEEYPDVLAEAAKLYETSPEEAAAYLTEYTIEKQNKALEDANTMYDELTWYMMNNTDTLRYSFSYGTLTMSDTRNQKPFVPSLAETEEAE